MGSTRTFYHDIDCICGSTAAVSALSEQLGQRGWTHRYPPCRVTMVYRHRLSWSRRTRTCNAPRRAIVSLSLAAGSSQRDAGWSAPPHRPIFSNNRPPCSRRRADRAGQRQRRAAGRRRRGCSPDAVHVFSDLARVRRLKLAQLRISLDLEEDLLAVLRQDLW